MPNQIQILQELLARDTWTLEEQRWMLQYLENNPGQPELETLLHHQLHLPTTPETTLSREESAHILHSVHQRSNISSPKKKGIVWKLSAFAAAAVLFSCLLFGAIYLIRKTDDTPGATAGTHTRENNIMPAVQGAILQLADGQVIKLDSLPNGAIAAAGDLLIYKKEGQITYSAKAGTNATALNTMATQKGNKYQLVLADGTIVWLNAASSITYPVTFTSNERIVNITGEAYFEVAKNKEKPFKVIANGMEIKVLGTHFNVNAYANEGKVNTTLLEGSVQITKGAHKSILQPGQQAIVADGNNPINIVQEADTDLAMAWINNKFLFKEADIQTVMRQIARWYDVDIAYTGAIPENLFSGDLSKTNNLSVLIAVLKESGLNLKLEGKTLFVMP